MRRMRRPRPRERGVALLLVLWVFMILGVLALDFAQYIRDDAEAALNVSDETVGYYLALAGMNRVIFEAEQERDENLGEAVDEDADTPDTEAGASNTLGVVADGQWHEDDFGGGRYAVRMTDEASRISINKASEALLTAVITNLLRGGNATTGMDSRTEREVSEIVDAILDWRDPDTLVRLHGAESDYYLGLRDPYPAKNGYFDSPDELLRVRGITPAIFYGADGQPGLRDIVSVFSRSPGVNVRTVGAPVLQVLLGIDADAAQQLIEQRDEEGAAAFRQQLLLEMVAESADLGANGLGETEPTLVTVEARADARWKQNQARVMAVVDLSSELAEGAKIVRWIDRAPWEAPLPATGTPRPGAAS
jgi:general secretion pathway protein K